jgi:hypothetical protein
MTDLPFQNKAVEDAIHSQPLKVRAQLLALRHLIFEIAAQTHGVGRIEESLRWGQASYLTAETGSGSTIRIDGRPNNPEQVALYFHCQSGLVDQFRELYGKRLAYEGKRALVFQYGQPLPLEIVGHCIALALTHHLRKKPVRKQR